MKEFKELKSSSGYIIVNRVRFYFSSTRAGLFERRISKTKKKIKQTQMKGMEKPTAHTVRKEDPKERKEGGGREG